MVDLADHIKRTDCSRLVLDCKNRTAEANKISFRGNLTNRVGKCLFQERHNQSLKPVILLSSAIYKMFAFLQVELNLHGRWMYSVWALMDEEVLKNCNAIIEVKTVDGKIFGAKLQILSLMSANKSRGMGSGQCMILFDEQLRQSGDSRQTKIFDFKVTLVTTQSFRDHLNDGPIMNPHEEYMNTVVQDPSSNCILINKEPTEPIQPNVSLVHDPVQVINDGAIGMTIANQEEVTTTTDLGDISDIIQALMEDPEFENSSSEVMAIRSSDFSGNLSLRDPTDSGEEDEDEGLPDLEDVSEAENQDQNTNT